MVTWSKKQKKALKKQTDESEHGLKRALQGSCSGLDLPSGMKKPKPAEVETIAIIENSTELQVQVISY